MFKMFKKKNISVQEAPANPQDERVVKLGDMERHETEKPSQSQEPSLQPTISQSQPTMPQSSNVENTSVAAPVPPKRSFGGILGKINVMSKLGGSKNSDSHGTQPQSISASSSSGHSPKLTSLMSGLRTQKQKEHIEWPVFTVAPTLFAPIPPDAKEAIYPLIRPYAYASIKRSADGSLLYELHEPDLAPDEEKMFVRLQQGLVQTLNISPKDVKNEEALVKLLEEHVRELMLGYGMRMTREQYLKIMYRVYRDFVGLNEIEALMRDPYIEDISCDGTGIPLFVIHQRFGSIKTSIVFRDAEQLRNFVVKLAERGGRYISYAEPLLDGSLPDGSRVQASLTADVTSKGPTFSIRKFPSKPFTPVDMLKFNTADAKLLSYLWELVENGANILISGATATGKTSMLNTVSFFMPPDAKVVSIEDTREINLSRENWIPAVARTGFSGTHVGEVTMFDLLKEAFRQNPRYIIVGEVRGEEANVMFQAMASGMTALSTMHAGTVEDALKRLETRPISLPPTLMETLDAVILMSHVTEKGANARRIRSVAEIEEVTESGEVKYNETFAWNPAKDTYENRHDSSLLREISKAKGLPLKTLEHRTAEKESVLKWLSKQGFDWQQVAKHISMYYTDRDSLLKLAKVRPLEVKVSAARTRHASKSAKHRGRKK